MFGYNASAQQQQLFADQFEQRGDGYVYRKTLKGPPIPVSAEERQRFIGDYARHMKLVKWLLMGGFALLTTAVVCWSVETETQLNNTAFIVAIAAMALAYVAFGQWAWNQPARELEWRTPVGRERSKGEFRRALLKTKSYGQIAAPAVIVALGALRFAQKDGFTEWGYFWLLLGAVCLASFAAQAFMKWRLERKKIDPSS
jgi:ammonia channel protein AmtB